MHTRLVRSALLLSLGLLLPTSAFAQTSSSALINEALDKPIELNLDTTLPQALKSIEEKTAVPLRAGSTVYDMLPWGEQTKLTAKISNQTLRQALTAITSKLGLRFTVGDDAVELRPIPALARLARRVTLEELSAIDELASRPYTDAGETPTLERIAANLDKSLTESHSNYVVENRVSDEAARQPVRLPRGVNCLEALDELNRQSRATWYPVGKNIVIAAKQELNQTLLNRPLTMRFNGVDVSQVLTELSRRSGVDFEIEPGAVQRIPPESRNVRLVLENVSAKGALESIAGFTGLGFVQREDGVYLWNPAANPVTRRPDRTIGIVTLDNGMQILLPENEVPTDVKQYLQLRREQAIKAIREQMKKEGFKPSTTQPTDG
ncbi:MAG: hypothetical protein JWM57_872 [Phycisphaerales bacterium]|nr:hypothetical protein [Phycisphaerales bacterium]